MRRSTKNKLIVLFIVLTFSLSSIAYIITSITERTEEKNFKPLENFVVEGTLDEYTENEYIRRGYTSVKFYYTDPGLLYFVEQLPDMMKTNSDQVQLIVQKIYSNQTTYVKILNIYYEREIQSPTEDSIFNTLCEVLISTPLDCGLRNMTI